MKPELSVGILPYTSLDSSLEPIKLYTRYEVVPIWGDEHPAHTMIRSTVPTEFVTRAQATAILEHFTRVYIEPYSDRWVDLGTCMESTSSNTLVYLYGVDVTGIEKFSKYDDMLKGPIVSMWPWASENMNDPLIARAYLKINRHLMNEKIRKMGIAVSGTEMTNARL